MVIVSVVTATLLTHFVLSICRHSLIPDDLVISPDQILDYAEKFLVIEPVLEAAAELLSVTLDLWVKFFVV